MSAAKIKKGDKVVVLAGKDKGRTGAVLQVMPKEDRVLVEGINVHARHRKPDQHYRCDCPHDPHSTRNPLRKIRAPFREREHALYRGGALRPRPRTCNGSRKDVARASYLPVWRCRLNWC